MKNSLTLGQVIDVMEIGEVAVKVDGNYEDCDVKDGVFFDEYDGGILKSIDGHIISICKAKLLNKKADYFVIMSKIAYNNMIKNNL